MREWVQDGKDSGIVSVPGQALALGTDGGVGVCVRG